MKNFIIVILICFLPSVIHATSGSGDQFVLQQFDNRNGLSNSAVNFIFQDTDQLLWIATWDGLNLYDGTSFHVFNYNKDIDFKSIGNNVIQKIAEDKSKNIWISTIEGISRYNKISGRFYNYFYEQHTKSKISEQEYQLAVDNTGNVFCLTQKQGLFYYHTQADTFQICLPQQSYAISKMVFDAENAFWALTKAGKLEVYRHSRTQFQPLQTFEEQHKIINLFYVNQQVFYQTSIGELYAIDINTLKKRAIDIQVPIIGAMTYYKGHYLLGWTGQGYGVFSPDFQSTGFIYGNIPQMQQMKITSWASGGENLLWAGTDGNGLLKIVPEILQFGYLNASNATPAYNKPVRAFCKVGADLWVGTKGGGIIGIKNFSYQNQNTQSRHYFLAPQELENNAVYALTKGTDGFIYIGTDGKGIGLYDLLNKKFLKWTAIQGHEQFPEFGSVYAILQDDDQSVWLGTSGYGLIHLKLHRVPREGVAIDFLTSYIYNQKNTGPANDIIYALTRGDKDHLWIACRYGGLNLLNKKTHIFRTFKAFSYEGSISHNDILALYKDQQQRIWIGTSYGLNWIQQEEAFRKDPIFQKLTTSNGLPNNTIHAIEEDGEGNIWVSTNKGLARIHPASLEISHYQDSDGLQSNEFSDGAVWKDTSGYLYFGGINGLNFFLPRHIRSNTFKTNLFISDIHLGRKAENEHNFMVLHANENSQRTYTLARNEGFFELQCKVINFLNAEKCEYAYYLDKYDKSWNYAGVKGKINYQNLPPGKYTLKVKWSNGEGIWTKNTRVFNLTVKPYFWLTWPAYLLYFLMLAIGGYSFYSYRKNKVKMKYQLAMEQLMREKEEQLHQQQLAFFTNITHELQTPLTLIMGTTEYVLQQKREHPEQKQNNDFFITIRKQAARLTYLVEQLLEFRKGEAGYLENNYTFLNVSELLHAITSLFIPLSIQHHMRYEIDIQGNVLEAVDQDKLEKIMFNLLSNAFKYSGHSETIRFIMVRNETDRTLKITVTNSGCELSEEQLHKLFDRFYTGRFSGVFGTGIGLAFTKQLVQLLNGTITVSSTDNHVTFNVLIPLLVENLKENKFKQQPSITVPYLYQSMVSLQSSTPISVVENNKQTILESLENNKRSSILLVEDEAEIRHLLKNILKENYLIYEARNGKEAMEIVKKVIPAVIISDIMMPDMDGLELCAKIKNTPATCHIAFLILSAKGDIAHKVEGYEVGADAYIAKPFNTDYLLVRIRKLLEYRKNLHNLFDDNTSIDLNKSTLVDDDRLFLDKVISLIRENMDAPDWGTVQLEECLLMSKMQLYRKLKTMTNMTPGEFVKQVRLKHAAYLLENTKLTVSEIFYCTGFNNQSYFFREFKKRYQCAPTEYRAQQQFGVLNSDPKI